VPTTNTFHLASVCIIPAFGQKDAIRSPIPFAMSGAQQMSSEVDPRNRLFMLFFASAIHISHDRLLALGAHIDDGGETIPDIGSIQSAPMMMEGDPPKLKWKEGHHATSATFPFGSCSFETVHSLPDADENTARRLGAPLELSGSRAGPGSVFPTSSSNQ
jgi:hypothetical protein